MTLKEKTFSAVRWTTFSTVSNSALTLLQMAVLARLLEPSDFGLMALVVAVIAFAQIFSDMGISNAIIHHQKISQEVLSSLFWLNVLASVFLMVLLMLFSQVIAELYHDPRIQSILILVSSSFLIIALGQQLRLIAEKELRFRQLAGIEVTSAVLAFIVAVLVALEGGGVYALVAGMLTSSIIATTLNWLILSGGWRPMWRLNFNEIRDFLSFGAYMVGYSLTNTINSQADVLIGGRVLGASSLGVYSLPKNLSLRLAMVINSIVTRVGFPAMSQAQGDQRLLKSIYLKTLRMTASVNFPIYFAIALFAPEIVTIMFGAKWQESIPILQILAFWGMVRSTGNPSGSLVFAMGRADLAFWWSLGLMMFLVPTYWIGSQYGIIGLALSMLVSMLLIPVPQWLIVIRPLCGAGFSEYFRQLAIPFAIALVSIAIAYSAALPFDWIVLKLGVGMGIDVLIYLVLSRWLNLSWFTAMAELLLGETRSKKLLSYKIHSYSDSV